MAGRAERIARNESRFRAVNERRFGMLRFLPGRGVYVCECARPDCTERIRLQSFEYSRIRADPTQFAVVMGHEDHSVEVVVEHHDSWLLVRKIGDAGEAAREAAPDEP
ncbi:MAG TPA: hypothetical protein VH306_05805 [Gaiellaceae bacterium]|jgi:hypothetical protein